MRHQLNIIAQKMQRTERVSKKLQCRESVKVEYRQASITERTTGSSHSERRVGLDVIHVTNSSEMIIVISIGWYHDQTLRPFTGRSFFILLN